MSNLEKVKQLVPMIMQVGEKYGFRAEIIAAIAWRESNFGASLDEQGYGDHRHGYGYMQVDVRSHSVVGKPDSYEHFDQAVSILNNMRNHVSRSHQDWCPEDQLRGAIAAYNAGPNNVRTIEGIDVGTTNNNYSADVLAKAKILKDYFK